MPNMAIYNTGANQGFKGFVKKFFFVVRRIFGTPKTQFLTDFGPPPMGHGILSTPDLDPKKLQEIPYRTIPTYSSISPYNDLSVEMGEYGTSKSANALSFAALSNYIKMTKCMISIFIC